MAGTFEWTLKLDCLEGRPEREIFRAWNLTPTGEGKVTKRKRNHVTTKSNDFFIDDLLLEGFGQMATGNMDGRGEFGRSIPALLSAADMSADGLGQDGTEPVRTETKHYTTGQRWLLLGQGNEQYVEPESLAASTWSSAAAAAATTGRLC